MRTNRLAGVRRPSPAITAGCLFAVIFTGTEGKGAGAARTTQGAAGHPPPIALLPPVIILVQEEIESEGKPSSGAAPSPAAAAAVSKAFLAEMTARKVGVILIGQDEIGPADLSRLDALAGCLARGEARPLTEAALSIEYPPESLEGIMERHRLDAVWVVTGITVLSGEGAGSRMLLRAALLDRNALVRFSDLVDEGGVAASGVAPAAPATEAAQLDLRDSEVARRAIEALLAEYRTEAERLEAEQAVARAAEVRGKAPGSPHPSDFRLGLGVYFVAGTDFWAGFLPKDSRWQFGYRYVRWTDNFEDPYTGENLTETTQTMQGPQVNYLFHPEKRGTWYLGTSVLQWSKSEFGEMNGVTDTASVIAPFLGGGYSRHLGKHGYWSGAIFLAPWADLVTDTGVSSDDSSGGFDIQLQIGGSF